LRRASLINQPHLHPINPLLVQHFFDAEVLRSLFLFDYPFFRLHILNKLSLLHLQDVGDLLNIVFIPNDALSMPQLEFGELNILLLDFFCLDLSDLLLGNGSELLLEVFQILHVESIIAEAKDLRLGSLGHRELGPHCFSKIFYLDLFSTLELLVFFTPQRLDEFVTLGASASDPAFIAPVFKVDLIGSEHPKFHRIQNLHQQVNLTELLP